MTVKQLIEALSDYDDDMPVRLMIQPSYPFEHNICDVIDGGSFGGDENVVYITEGDQLGYGSKDAW